MTKSVMGDAGHREAPPVVKPAGPNECQIVSICGQLIRRRRSHIARHGPMGGDGQAGAVLARRPALIIFLKSMKFDRPLQSKSARAMSKVATN